MSINLRMPFLVLAALTANVAAVQAVPPKPNLVVVISIDQFPFEYLERFKTGFDRNSGFAGLAWQGANFTQCRHRQAFTMTGPGHAAMLTGAHPDRTGIVNNVFFDRATGKEDFNCVRDNSESGRLVGVEQFDLREQVSPRTLMAPTVGDMLKLATNGRSRVFGVSLKDRGGVLLAGRLADAAFWFHAASGRWVTSKHYREKLPVYLQEYNDKKRAGRFAGQKWELLHPRERYLQFDSDDSPFEGGNRGEAKSLGQVFPHPLPNQADATYHRMLELTPFGNQLTLDVAQLIVENEKLGQRASPDLLAISLSSNDYVGHVYGPYSFEVEDMTYRTDQQLRGFLRSLRETLKPRGWVAILTADHGIAPIPEYAAARKLAAARNPLGKAEDLVKSLEGELQTRLGVPAAGKKYVINITESSVYLNRDIAELAGERFVTAQRIARDWLLDKDAVSAAFGREQLLGTSAGDELLRQFQLSFHPRRSGDVLYALQPFHMQLFSTRLEAYRTTHGSPWNYDSHVPLIVFGHGITPGRYDRPVSPTMIAPTVSRLLGIEPPPMSTTEVLHEVLGM